MKVEAVFPSCIRIAMAGVLATVALFLAQVGPACASELTEAQGTVDKAKAVFNSFMADANYSWLHNNLHKARGLLIYPQILKAGFILGGSGGTGVLVVKDEKSGDWSQPAFYTVGAVTFGLQIGAEAAEVVVMVMSKKGVDSLLASSVKLGGSASIAVGPIGIGAKGELPADFVAFSRARGLYGGVNLEGSLIEVRDGLNRAYYGKEVTPLDIIVRRSASNPGSGDLLAALKKGSRQNRNGKGEK